MSQSLSVWYLFVLVLPLAESSLAGHPAMLHCGQHPVKPVSWTCRHSPDSSVQKIITKGMVVSDFAGKFSVRNSSLIINTAEAYDDGTYNCTDAAGDLRSIQLTILGKVYDQYMY